MSTVRPLREIFESALQLAPEARRVFLERECPDPGRRADIERMIAAHGEDSLELLDRSLADVAAQLSSREAQPEAGDWIGRTIGGFRLVESIGQGGSSLVFRGEREHEGVTQRAAVKVLRRIMLGAAEHRRFRRERHALAQLSHPGIAAYLDGGVTDAGIAYIVMELVVGERITDYARQRVAGIDDRVRMMVDVCRAVDAAHRALIVHRDLKPSNVMVTADGHIKLLDFGIAKFLDGAEDATETQHRALTPAYAAPEQFDGGAITTATDVYALGVLLIELLLGQRPIDQHTPGMHSKAPSTLVSEDTRESGLPEPASATRTRLRGDLDNVALKAVALRPDRRYPSAEALAADLERYLRNQPVQAHPPSMAYFVRKFVQRNAVATAVTALALLGIGASLAIALVQADRAQRQAARAEATLDFLVSVFRSAEPAGARERPATVVEVTEAAVVQARSATRMDAQVRDELLIELGSVLRGQGEFERATATLGDALAGAIAREGSAGATVVRARLELLQNAIEHERLDEAGAELARLDALAEPPTAVLLARQRGLEAQWRGKRGEEQAALAAAHEALAICRPVCSRVELAEALTTLGSVAGRFNRNADALGAYEEALAVTRAQFGDVHVQTAEALSGVSGALRRMGRLPEALQAAREIAVIDDATLPKTHWRRITHLNYLSNIQSLTGDVRGALDSARSALAIHRANYGDDSPASWVLLQGVGVMEGWLGQYAEATRDMGAALALQERTMGADASGTGMTRCMLGTMFAEWGQLDVAEGHCSKAIADLRRGEPGERVYLATALWYRARIDIERGDAARAMQGIDEALSIVDALGADFSAVARTQMLATRASALQRKGDFSAAAAGMREVLEVLSQQTGAKTARTEMNIGLAEIALAEGRQADAARFAAAAQAIMATTEWPEPQLKRRMDALRTRLGPASAPAAD